MSSRGPLGAEGQGQLPALPPLNPDLLANIVSSSFDTITGQMSFGGWNISPEKTAASFERKTLRFSSLSCLQQRWPLCLACSWGGVTFSVYDSAPVAKFLNPGPEIFQIWESDSRSDFGYNHRSNRNSPMLFPMKWPHRFLLLPKLKIDSGSRSCFSQILDSGSERKTQNPAGVDFVRKLLKKAVATQYTYTCGSWNLKTYSYATCDVTLTHDESAVDLVGTNWM